MNDQDLMIKMPRKKNTFSGRCTMTFEEFKDLKLMVGTGKLKLIFTDGVVRTYPIEPWMIEHAKVGSSEDSEYMLVTYSKHVYKRDRMNEKKFGRK